MLIEFARCHNAKNRDDDRILVWATLKLSNVPV